MNPSAIGPISRFQSSIPLGLMPLVIAALMVANSTNLAINVSLYKELPYNPVTDLTPLLHHAFSPFVLVVNSSLPVTSVSDLVKLAKAKPGQLSYGSAGPGTAHHLFAEMLKTRT